MKKILLCLFVFSQIAAFGAKEKAPKWMNKQRKAVVMITAYGENDEKIGEGLGFFISEDGKLLTGYSLFQGAQRAVATDADGKTYEIVRIQGADELYDVICCEAEIPKKVAYFPLATVPVAKDAPVYMMLFSKEKKPVYKSGQVTEVSKLKDSYNYYKTSIPLESTEVNAPVLTETGEVFGFAQSDAGGDKTVSYAVSAGYTANLKMSNTDMFNSTYTSIGIKKAWPEKEEDALVALYLLSGRQKAKSYLETLNDFVATFPNSDDAYQNRASFYALRRTEMDSTADGQKKYLDLALEDMNRAVELSDKKADAYYNNAKLIYNVALTDTTLADENWSVESAVKTLNQAISIEDQPVFHQLEGDILLNNKQYQQAYDSYMIVNRSNMASADSYYWAAKAKQNIEGADPKELLALMDSAIAKFGSPIPVSAAPYLLERIEIRQQLGQYALIVSDYNLYYELVQGKVNDAFYFFREQAKSRVGDLDGALSDIQQAIKMNPSDAEYHAEEASLYVRKKDYVAALASTEKALSIAPDYAACHRLKGLCLARTGKNSEACVALEKAKELGDPVAERMLNEQCK